MEDHSKAEAVTLYGHSACGQCKVSILAMTQAGIHFQYRDTRLDPAAQKRVEELGYSAVPVTEVNGKHWYGFLPDRIKELAALKSSFHDESDLVMELAIHRGYSDDLTDGERDDILDEASWILTDRESGSPTATLLLGSTPAGELQSAQQAS